MVEEHDTEHREPQLFTQSSGEQLKSAREKKGLTIDQVASETKIPLRQIELIEAGELQALPGRTYAIGFSRTYARLLGLNEGEVLNKVRAELAQTQPAREQASHFEPGDPARVPSSGVAWMLALAAIVLLAGFYFAYRTFIAPDGELPPVVEQAAAPAPVPTAATPAPAATPTPAGDVVFTALEEGIWVKFYDASGAQLMQKQMAKGETFTVPATAQGPKLWTGRPDALSITIGGQAVPKIAEREGVVKDVPVNSEALLARGAPTMAATPAAAPSAAPAAPVPSPSPTI